MNSERKRAMKARSEGGGERGTRCEVGVEGDPACQKQVLRTAGCYINNFRPTQKTDAKKGERGEGGEGDQVKRVSIRRESGIQARAQAPAGGVSPRAATTYGLDSGRGDA